MSQSNKKLYAKQYRDAHKKESYNYQKKYYLKNKSRIDKRHALYDNKNKDKRQIWYQTNKIQIIANVKQNYEKNRIKILRYKKRYYTKYRDELNRKSRIRSKDYYLKNKQKINETSKRYYLKNKNKHTLLSKNWMNKNRKDWNKHIRNRFQNDINFKLRSYLRNRLFYALKGNPKVSTTMKLVGCSIETLKNHLELRFKPGMNWNNYGQWHIDHIKPCAKFDLSKPKEQRACFHYMNLQPLWAKENLQKSDKFIEA